MFSFVQRTVRRLKQAEEERGDTNPAKTPKRGRSYACKKEGTRQCAVERQSRNSCRSCRLNKCIQAGMKVDGEQKKNEKCVFYSIAMSILNTFFSKKKTLCYIVRLTFSIL